VIAQARDWIAAFGAGADGRLWNATAVRRLGADAARPGVLGADAGIRALAGSG
jgi:hypothetical protein